MPQFQIQDTQSGRTMTVEGDSPPSEQDAADLFAAHDAPPQMSQYNPTFGQKVGDLLHSIRTSEPVEKIMGQTPEELASNPPLKSAPPTTSQGVMGLFESTKPVMEPVENPKTAEEGLHAWAANVVNSVASPGGMATLPLGGAGTPLLVKRALGLAFGAQGANMTYESAKDLVTHAFKNNGAQNVMDIGNILTGGLMTAGGVHALKGQKVAETPVNEQPNPSPTKVEGLSHGDEIHAILPSPTKVEGLSHGDEIHAILPDGSEIRGTVVGTDKEGNAQVLTPDGDTHTVPERMVTEDANQEQGPVEDVRSETPGTSAQVAEGEPGELQPSAGAFDSEEAGLPQEGLTDYDRYQQLTSSLKGKSMDEAQPILKEIEAIKNRNGGMVPQPEESSLPPEHQALIQQELDAANGAGVRIINPYEATDENAPFASGDRVLAKPDMKNGQVLINGPEMSRWLNGIPEDKRPQAIRAVLSEEAIHLATPKDAALTYWNNLTKPEQWIVKKRYGSGQVEQSDQNWGYEAMRFRMQQAMKMTPTEYVNALRGDRSMTALKTLTALESVVRGTRENLLKTKASQESLALLDKVQNNINTAKFALGGGTPAAMSAEKAEETAKDLEKQAEVYLKLGAHDEAEEMLDMARWIRQKGDEQSFPAAMSGELPMEGGTGKKKFESKAEQLARLIGKKPTEGKVDTNKAGRPAAESVNPFDTKQPVLWTKEGLPLTAKTGEKPQVATTAELGLPQRPKTAEAIESAGNEIISGAMERAVDAYKQGGVSLGGPVGMPKFEDFSRLMRQRNPDLTHDQLLPVFSKALGNALRNASDNTLMALQKAEFGEPEKGSRTILPGGDEVAAKQTAEAISKLTPQQRDELRNKYLSPEEQAIAKKQDENRLQLSLTADRMDYTAEQRRRNEQESRKLASMSQSERDAYLKEKEQRLGANRKFANAPKEVSPAAIARQDDEFMRRIKRNRANVVSSLFKASIKKAMQQDTGMLHRKTISPEEIQEGGYTFIDNNGNRVGMPSYMALDPNGVGRTTIEALTRGNRRLSTDDWRTTKKVATIQDKNTGEVHVVSVFRHPRDEKDIRFTDPRVPMGESGLEYGPAFFNRYRLLYATLLDEPVRNFHEKYADLNAYNEGFGNEALRHTVTGEGRYVETTAAEREAEESGFRTDSKFVKAHLTDPSDPTKTISVWTDPISGEVLERDDNPHTLEAALGWAGEGEHTPIEYQHIEGLPTTQVESSSSFMGPHADVVRDRTENGRTRFSKGPLTKTQADALYEYLESKKKYTTEEAIKQLSITTHPRKYGAISAVAKIAKSMPGSDTEGLEQMLTRVADKIGLIKHSVDKPSDFAKILGVEQPKVSLSGEPAPPGRELTMPIDRRAPTKVNPDNVPPGSIPAKVPPPAETMAPKPATGQYLTSEDMAHVMQEVKKESVAEPTPEPGSKGFKMSTPAGGEVKLHPPLQFEQVHGVKRLRGWEQQGRDFGEGPAAMSGEAKDVIENAKSRVLEGIQAYLSARGNKETIPMLKDKASTLANNAGYAAGKSVLMEQVNDHATISRALSKLAKGDFAGMYKTFQDHLNLKKQNLRTREAALAVLHSGAIVNKYRYSPSALERLAEIREADPDFGLVDKLMKGDLVGTKAELLKRIKEKEDVDPTGHSKWHTMLYEINQIPEKLRKNSQQGELEGGGVGSVSAELQKIGGKLYDASMRKIEKQLINEGLLSHHDVTRVFDDSKKARLDLFLNQLAGAEKDARRIMADGNVAENIRQKQRLAEIERLRNGVEYAKAHWGDDEMNRVATRARKEFDDQYDREKATGSEVKYDEDFVPGRYDAELFNNGEWGFHGSRGSKILGTNTYDAKAFQNHYDAVSAGPYIAVTHDPAVLVEHRVRTGAGRINKEQFKESLLSMHDDNLGAPIAVKTKPNIAGNPTPDVPRGISRSMYKVSEVDSDLAVLRGSYSRLVNRMLKPSAIDDSGALSALLAGSQRLKHMALLGDIYHMSKMGLYSLASARGNFNKVNWRRGLSVLDYRAEDLDRAAASGMLDPRTVAWAKEKIPANINGQKTTISRHAAAGLLQRQGFNVGQIQDAIYKDIASSVPKILGAIPGVNTDMLNKFQKCGIL